jgi:uncharacterized membrane protein
VSSDPATIAAIIGMAIVTYLTRLSGILVAGRLSLTGRARVAFDAIPTAVLVAVIAPTVLTQGWPETLAAAVTIIAATRLPLATGVVAVVLFRSALT